MKTLKYFKMLFVLTIITFAINSDEFAPWYQEAIIYIPPKNTFIPQNSRFLIRFFPSRRKQSTPVHEYRLLDNRGREIKFTKVPWESCLQIIPSQLLTPGKYTLQVRQPASEESLGPWQDLVNVTVIAQIDNTAPVFQGVVTADVQTVVGYVRITPCHFKKAWVIKTKLTFAAALDPPYPHEELVYVLERYSPSLRKWERVYVFQPVREKDNMIIEWESNPYDEWNKIWIYRIRVRDIAGNETIGVKTITVQNPQKPDKPVSEYPLRP